MRAKGRGARRRERPVRDLDHLLARSECGGRTFPPPIVEEKDLKRGKGGKEERVECRAEKACSGAGNVSLEMTLHKCITSACYYASSALRVSCPSAPSSSSPPFLHQPLQGHVGPVLIRRRRNRHLGRPTTPVSSSRRKTGRRLERRGGGRSRGGAYKFLPPPPPNLSLLFAATSSMGV